MRRSYCYRINKVVLGFRDQGNADSVEIVWEVMDHGHSQYLLQKCAGRCSLSTLL